LVAGGIDYEMINKQFEDMSEKIKKIELPEIKFPNMPKSLSIEDVERLLKKYDKNEELDTVVSLVKSIREMTDFLVEEYATIKQNSENIESKIDDLSLQDTIDNLKEIH
jgi:phosphopantetheine adenylyltransferase